MHAEPDKAPVEIRLREAEAIARAYRTAAQGDAWSALVAAIADALADLEEAERRLVRQGQLISRGYARGQMGTRSSTHASADARAPAAARL